MKNESPINEEYDAILSTLFNSCNTSGTGSISIDEFGDLCAHLNLSHHAELLKFKMFSSMKRERLEYIDFRDGLVEFIVSSGQMNDSENPSEQVNNSEESYVNSSYDREYSSSDECWHTSNNNKPLQETPKPRRKYGRKTEPDMELHQNIENVNPNENARPPAKPVISQVKDKETHSPPTSRYLTPSYTPTRATKRAEPEIFAGAGDDDTWKKLDSSWNEIENKSSPKEEASTNSWLRGLWRNVVGGESTSMNKQQLGELMKSVGLPVSEDDGQLNDLFNFLPKDENGLIPFKQFCEEMMSFICDTPTNENVPTNPRTTIQHSTPIESSCPAVEMTSPTTFKTEHKSPDTTSSFSSPDITDLCPPFEIVDPSALAAANRRRRRRASRITKGSERMRNKNSSLPKYHPIKKRQLNNSPLSYLVESNERYVSVDTLKQYWLEEGLDNTSDILSALQVPEHETSLSIEALTDVFEEEINNNLSFKAFAALLKQGVRYYKRHCDEMSSMNESTETKSSTDQESLLEIQRLQEQFESSQERFDSLQERFISSQERYESSKAELNRYIEINAQLTKEIENLTKSLEFKTQHESEIFEELSMTSEKHNETLEENNSLRRKLEDAEGKMQKLGCTLRRSFNQIESLKKETEIHRQRADEFFALHQQHVQKDITTCNDILQEIRDSESIFLPQL